MKSSSLLLVLAPVLVVIPSLAATPLSDETLVQLRFDQKLNTQVSGELRFRDESGAPMQLGQYLGRKPVILVLGYYQCPMLCSLLLNGLVESLEDLKWNIGNQFDVLNVSIDPRETPSLAAAKKRVYLKRYGRTGAAQGWHFLTGDEPAVRALSQEVGFHYAYDPASEQFAHPSGLVILTPQGKVARYLFGVTFSPRELLAGLQAASREKVSSPIRDLVLLCFHYNPIHGKYGPAIMGIIRALSVATVLGLGWLVLAMSRSARASAPTNPNPISPSAEPQCFPVPNPAAAPSTSGLASRSSGPDPKPQL